MSCTPRWERCAYTAKATLLRNVSMALSNATAREPVGTYYPRQAAFLSPIMVCHIPSSASRGSRPFSPTCCAFRRYVRLPNEFEIIERSEELFFHVTRCGSDSAVVRWISDTPVMTELTPQERSMLRYIVSKSGVWVRNSSGDETIARLFELKLITCLSDPTRPLRKVGATARGHLEARTVISP